MSSSLNSFEKRSAFSRASRTLITDTSRISDLVPRICRTAAASAACRQMLMWNFSVSRRAIASVSVRPSEILTARFVRLIRETMLSNSSATWLNSASRSSAF